MVNIFNLLKALFVCTVTTILYSLYTTTSDFQSQLAKEGQDVGKIEALMHYSTLTDVWSRILSGGFHLFFISFISCLLLMLWLKSPDSSHKL